MDQSLRRRKLKANASPDFSLYLLSLHGDILKDNLFLFLHKIGVPLGCGIRCRGSSGLPGPWREQRAMPGPQHALLQRSRSDCRARKPLLYPTSFCNKANHPFWTFCIKKVVQLFMLPLQHRSSAGRSAGRGGRAWAHTCPRTTRAEPGCAWPRAGSWAAPHSDGPGDLSSWGPELLGRPLSHPREAPARAVQTRGRDSSERQGPAEGSRLPSRPSPSQLLRPFSGGRGPDGYRSQDIKEGIVIKTRFPHQKSWHLSSTFTEGKWPGWLPQQVGGGASPAGRRKQHPDPPPSRPPEQAEWPSCKFR